MAFSNIGNSLDVKFNVYRISYQQIGINIEILVVGICRNSYSKKNMICNEHSNASLILHLTYLQ